MAQKLKQNEINNLIKTANETVLSGGGVSFFNFNNLTLLPGFCDVHVHFREPGFSYKETIKTGSMAAAAGGYTAVCTMPNLNPVPDSIENINLQREIIKRDSVINVYPYASITVKQQGETLADLDGLKDLCIAYSDDGRGVQNGALMEEAMKEAKQNGKMIVAHCEVNELLKGGYIHDGEYAKKHNHKGICSESEYAQIARDIELVRKTGVKYHVCHISCKESVELIRQAKKEGLNITCETGPHYLILNDSNLKEDGKFKMNPPLRAEADRLALIEGIKDGTIDMIATDHAPHSAEEKAKGLKGSAFGIVGLETAFPLLYTHLVKTGIISLNKLVDLMCIAPRKRFNITGDIGFSVWDLEKEIKIDPNKFLSMGKATPFEKDTVYGECLLTYLNNEVVFLK